MNPTDPAAHSTAPPLSCLQAGLARVMTLFLINQDVETSRTVLRLLSALATHPDVLRHPGLAPTYRHLLDVWMDVAVRLRADSDAAAAGARACGMH